MTFEKKLLIEKTGKVVNVVIGGDFNAFPNYDGKQLDPLLEAGFKHYNNDTVSFTFFGYPYDLGLYGSNTLNDILKETKEMNELDTIRSFINKVLEIYSKPIIAVLDWLFVIDVLNLS